MGIFVQKDPSGSKEKGPGGGRTTAESQGGGYERVSEVNPRKQPHASLDPPISPSRIPAVENGERPLSLQEERTCSSPNLGEDGWTDPQPVRAGDKESTGGLQTPGFHLLVSII